MVIRSELSVFDNLNLVGLEFEHDNYIKVSHTHSRT